MTWASTIIVVWALAATILAGYYIVKSKVSQSELKTLHKRWEERRAAIKTKITAKVNSSSFDDLADAVDSDVDKIFKG